MRRRRRRRTATRLVLLLPLLRLAAVGCLDCAFQS